MFCSSIYPYIILLALIILYRLLTIWCDALQRCYSLEYLRLTSLTHEPLVWLYLEQTFEFIILYILARLNILKKSFSKLWYFLSFLLWFLLSTSIGNLSKRLILSTISVGGFMTSTTLIYLCNILVSFQWSWLSRMPKLKSLTRGGRGMCPFVVKSRKMA